MKGYDQFEPSQSIRSTLLLVFTLCIRSSPSLVFVYLEYLPLFDSTTTKDILVGLSTSRHTIWSLLPDGVPSGRRDLGPLRRRRLSTPSWIVQARAPGIDRSDIRKRGAAPAPRSQTVIGSAESSTRWFVPVFGD
jgi:hypothetical protein